MIDFDPGPGWREVPRSVAARHDEVVSYRAPRGQSPRVRTWIPVMGTDIVHRGPGPAA